MDHEILLNCIPQLADMNPESTQNDGSFFPNKKIFGKHSYILSLGGQILNGGTDPLAFLVTAL